MSEIPLIWVKRWTQNNYHFVVFCEEQYDDTYKAYAHTDADGNVLPVTYFPMYEGSVVENRMRSLSGLTPTASMTDEQETTAAKQNGDRWDKQSFSEINLMYEMCTMITCSTNYRASSETETVSPTISCRPERSTGKDSFSVIHRPHRRSKYSTVRTSLLTTGNV